MRIEIVAFYPNQVKTKKSILLGTLHIHLPEISADIRGIRVFKKGKKVTFFMNRGVFFEENTGKKGNYPIFSFKNVDKNKAFLDTLQHVGYHYLESQYPQCLLPPRP